jgi:hypothetical protein
MEKHKIIFDKIYYQIKQLEQSDCLYDGKHLYLAFYYMHIYLT